MTYAEKERAILAKRTLNRIQHREAQIARMQREVAQLQREYEKLTKGE